MTAAHADRALHVVTLGVMPYAQALAVQRAAAQARIDGARSQDVLLLVEHPPVITYGRSAKQEHLLLDRRALAARGVELFEVERGGDVTFHGPGQLVGYPIIDLREHRQDLHWYLRQLEQVLIDALAVFGVAAERRPSLTGVWTGGRKIASIGVHARQWVTWHGFALNVATDLSYFDLIVPCGIADVEMTSVSRELERANRPQPGVDSAWQARDAVANAASNVFGLRAVTEDADAFLASVSAPTER
jgi:lipoate-protein ligase B